MPNRWTFTILPIKQLIYKYCPDGKGWVDPFAGENSPAEMTNDINPERPTKHHKDALDFIKGIGDNSANGILFDPPYSFTQAAECYKNFGKILFSQRPTDMKYWADIKTEISRKVVAGGIVITCGWNSNGIGRGRGFEMLEVLIVHHGGSKNDTIVTVERKVQSQY